MAEQPRTRIDLLRHGEPEGGQRYRGQIDDPLSESGWGQMWRALGDADGWDVVISSPLSRCEAFARALSENRGLDLEVEPRIKEIGFGRWEGRSKAELLREDPQQLDRFYQTPLTAQPEGAEPIADFYARVSTAFDDWLVRYRHRHLLVIGHAGAMRAIITHVLHAPLPAMFAIKVPYAGVTRIEVPDNQPPQLIYHARSRL